MEAHYNAINHLEGVVLKSVKVVRLIAVGHLRYPVGLNIGHGGDIQACQILITLQDLISIHLPYLGYLE